jgi:hypothetical protein
VVYANNDLLGYSAKQEEHENQRAKPPAGNFGLKSLIHEFDWTGTILKDLNKMVEEKVAEYIKHHPGKNPRYARYLFDEMDTDRTIDRDHVYFKEKSPFSIIQNLLNEEKIQQQIINELCIVLHQVLYPGYVRTLGTGACVRNVNNVFYESKYTILWTHPELYLTTRGDQSDAAKMYYLLVTPFIDNDTGIYKWICYKLEIGRRGDTNYKIIATIFRLGNICDPLDTSELGIKTQEFIKSVIENYKSQMQISCSGVSGLGGGGGGGAPIKRGSLGGGGGWGGGSRKPKQKSFQKRKTQRRKRNTQLRK